MDTITDISGFLRKMQRGRPLNAEATTLLLNRIFNILEGLAGEGCMVDKPLDRKGLGWKIVIDGSHSDLEPAGRVPMPFELIAVDNAWHVWLLDAEVVVNNYHADKAANLQTDGGGRWTAATFAPSSSVYLYVMESSETSTKHGANCYTWNVSTSVPEGALVSVLLGTVSSETLAVQKVRGNQIFYTFADSEIITHDSANAALHVVTSGTSGAMPVDDHLAFVIREGGVLKYYKATDLLKVAYTRAKELMRNPPDPDDPTSDIMPIGDETYDEWEAQIKAAIRNCLIADHWPYMPEFGGESMFDSDPSQFSFFGGWGAYDEIKDVFVSWWRGIDSGMFDTWHIPKREDMDEILRLLQKIQDRLDYLTDDPDGPQGPQKSLLAQMCEAAGEASSAASTLTTLLTAISNGESLLGGKSTQAYSIINDCTTRLGNLDTRKADIDADVTALEGLV